MGIRRFVRITERLVASADLRLPEFISQSLAALPRSRRYIARPRPGDIPVDGPSSLGLEAVLRAEAEDHLANVTRGTPETWRRSGDTAHHQLASFLDRLCISELHVSGMFSSTATGSATSEVQRGRNAVTVGTSHSAKGRQWPCVFVARFNEEVGFPLSAGAGLAALEEQRLAYVACSRAQIELEVSYSLSDPDRRLLSRSRFLSIDALANRVQLMEVESNLNAELEWVHSHIRSSLVEGSRTWRKFVANPSKPFAKRLWTGRMPKVRKVAETLALSQKV